MSKLQPGSVWADIRTALRGAFINGQLNPVRLKAATRGYSIQSSIFHIPDRFGFFSPGPPILQVREVAALIFAILDMVSCLQLALIMYIILRRTTYGSDAAIFLIANAIWAMPLEWVRRCRDHRRSPDYDWAAEEGVAREMMESGVSIKSELVP